MENVANTPAYVSILLNDLVFVTRGGPAPSVAPDHTEVLLPRPSPTLGQGSVPDKRVRFLRGPGPKLPWQYVRVRCMDILDARMMEGPMPVTPAPRFLPPARGPIAMAMAAGGGEGRKTPVLPPAMATAGPKGGALAASIQDNYIELVVYVVVYIRNLYFTLVVFMQLAEAMMTRPILAMAITSTSGSGTRS